MYGGGFQLKMVTQEDPELISFHGCTDLQLRMEQFEKPFEKPLKTNSETPACWASKKETRL